MDNYNMEYRTVLENISDGFWMVDAETHKIVDVNRALCKLIDYSSEEIIGKTPFDFVPEEHRKALEAHRESVSEISTPFNISLRKKNGSECPVALECHSCSDGRNSAHFCFTLIKDLSKRKRMESELARLAIAVEQSENTIVITDTNGTIEFVNPAFTKTTGYSARQAIGQNPKLLKSGVQGPEFYEALWQTISSGNVWKGKFVNRRKDGSTYWERATISPVKNHHGDITHFVAIKEDITTEVTLSEKLNRQKAELQLILDTVPIGIAYVKNRKLIQVNRAMAALHGSTPEELTGKDTSFIYPTRQAFEEFGEIVYSELAEKGIAVHEPSFVRRDGSRIYGRLTGRLINIQEPKAGSIWMLEDITERHLMQESIVRRDRI